MRPRLGLLVLLTALTGCPETMEPVPPAPEGCTIESPTEEFAVTLIRSETPGYVGNTVPAIRDAFARGYEYIEVDVVLSGDGELIPGRHNELVAFTTCTGWVSFSSSEDLAACEYLLAPGTPVAPLYEGLEGTDFAGVYVDMKLTMPEFRIDTASAVDAVISLHERLGRPEWLVAMSYDPDVTAALVRAGIRTGHKGYPAPEEAEAFAEEASVLGAEMMCVKASSLSGATIARAHELGVWQLPWESQELTDSALIVGLIDAGVGGLITEVPDGVQTVADMRCSP